MGIAQIFRTILLVSPFADGKYWYLRKDLIWDAASGTQVVVPTGFVTDFASVPRPIWWLFPAWAKYGTAAIVHDFCYWDQKHDRKTADGFMLEAMTDLHVGRIARYLIYFALRLFGCFAWRRNRKRKSQQPKLHAIYVLPKFPTDPLETWETWKQELLSNVA